LKFYEEQRGENSKKIEETENEIHNEKLKSTHASINVCFISSLILDIKLAVVLLQQSFINSKHQRVTCRCSTH
jgi:hypothetical protein